MSHHHPDPVPVEGIAGLLAAYTAYPLVALGEAHWLQQEADFIADLCHISGLPRSSSATRGVD